MKLAGVAAGADVAARQIAHVGVIIMMVNNASRLMASVRRWGGLAGVQRTRALDMVMRDGLSN